jgi:hypothetical protein
MRRRMNKSEAGGGTVVARMIKVVQQLKAIRNPEASSRRPLVIADRDIWNMAGDV